MRYLILILIFICSNTSFGQDTNTVILGYQIVNGDTVPVYDLPEVPIHGNDSIWKYKWARACYFVPRIYPYVEVIQGMLDVFEADLELIEKKSERKKYMRKAHKELRKEFGDEIRMMSVDRGWFLCTMLHRNTGMTAYEIISRYKSKGKATLMQGLSRLGGANIKMTFDPLEDRAADIVMKLIDSGRIRAVPRPPKSETGRRFIRKKRREKQKAEKVKQKASAKAVKEHQKKLDKEKATP